MWVSCSVKRAWIEAGVTANLVNFFTFGIRLDIDVGKFFESFNG